MKGKSQDERIIRKYTNTIRFIEENPRFAIA